MPNEQIPNVRAQTLSNRTTSDQRSDSKDLFDYWHDKVQLRNRDLIAAPEHVPTQTLRHDCTNYDDLIYSTAVKQLDDDQRSRVITIIKYQCTAKVLQYRAGLLRERAAEFQAEFQKAAAKAEKDGSRLLGIIKALQEMLFGKDNEIESLRSQVKALAAANEAMNVEAETNKAKSELQSELAKLKKRYDAVEKRRKELAHNNMSLGGRLAHTQRYKRQRDEARAELEQHRQQIQSLTHDNQQLRVENEQLHQKLKQFLNPMSAITE